MKPTMNAEKRTAAPQSKRRNQPQNIPDQGFVRLSGFLPFTGVCSSTLWAWVRSGKWPKPYKLSARVTAWDSREVLAALEAMKAGGAK